MDFGCLIARGEGLTGISTGVLGFTISLGIDAVITHYPAFSPAPIGTYSPVIPPRPLEYNHLQTKPENVTASTT